MMRSPEKPGGSCYYRTLKLCMGSLIVRVQPQQRHNSQYRIPLLKNFECHYNTFWNHLSSFQNTLEVMADNLAMTTRPVKNVYCPSHI